MCKDCKEVKDNVGKSPLYNVKGIINKNFWNEDLKRYLIPPFKRGDIVTILETNEIEFTTTEIWRVVDRLYDDIFESLTISKIK